MSQWDREIDINIITAQDIIEEQFSNLTVMEIKDFGEGWDNSAFLVNNEIIFRFPRRKIAVELIKKETDNLEKIAESVNLALPVPVYKGKPSKKYPHPFMGYKSIDGETSCRVKLTREEKKNNIPFLIEFLKKLHSLDIKEFDIPYYEFARFDPVKRLEQLKEKIGTLFSNRVKLKLAALKIADFIDLPPINETPHGLIHGDLYSRHILIDKKRVSGIIDWGDLHIGPFARDLAIGFLFFHPEDIDEFFDSYGLNETYMKKLSLWRALDHTCSLTQYAYDIDDKILINESNRIFNLMPDFIDVVQK